MEVCGIALRPAKHAQMQVLDEAKISVTHGIQGDVRGRPGPRQVTLLSVQSWNATCDDLGKYLAWITRRANLFVDDIEFGPHHVGKCLLVGRSAILKVTGETRPCKRMDEAYPGLREALEPGWRGGARCTVVRSGGIIIGSPISFFGE